MFHSKSKHITIISGIILLFVYLLDPISLVESKQTKLQVYIANSSLSADQANQVINDFKEDYLNDQTDQYGYLIDSNIFLSINEPTPVELIDAGRFTSHIAGKELDLFIAQKEIIEYYYELDGFENLESFIQNKSLNLNEEKIVGNEEDMYAVKINELLPYYESHEEVWAAIPKTSERKEIAISFINYILEEM